MLICEDAMILSVPSPLVGDFPSFWELGVAQLVAENFEDEEGGADAGEVEEGVWSAGTVMGLIDSVVTCEELCRDIVTEAETVIQERLVDCVTQAEYTEG